MRGNRVMVHGIVIGLILAFPWTLVLVMIVGATSSAVKRSLENYQISRRVSRRKRSAPSQPFRTHHRHPRPVI